MNLEMKEKYTVNGFLFGDEEDVELANQELAAIQFIDKKIENRSGETILGVYEGALEKRMFRTPVGYCYLHDLQKRMLKLGVKKERFSPVPMYQVFNDSYKTKEVPKRIRAKKKNQSPNQKKMRYSIWGNIILLLLVILLFVIAMTGETANAINYRRAITNEYSAWEEELNDRERVVREKERELGIPFQNQQEDEFSEENPLEE